MTQAQFDFECGSLFDGGRWLLPVSEVASDFGEDNLSPDEWDGAWGHYVIHPADWDGLFDAITDAGMTVGALGGQLVKGS